MRAQAPFELVRFETTDGGSIEGALFDSGVDRVVIFAHGAVFNKESWYFLNEKLQEGGISSLAIDFRGYGNSTAGKTGNKYYDILGAIAYLEDKGFRDINIVGGSMGGAAVLTALGKVEVPVNRVVLLAPAGGPPISSDKIEKLFVVSQNEGLYQRVMQTYQESADPKEIEVYAGSAHAQHMFKEAYADELVGLIINFLSQD